MEAQCRTFQRRTFFGVLKELRDRLCNVSSFEMVDHGVENIAAENPAKYNSNSFFPCQMPYVHVSPLFPDTEELISIRVEKYLAKSLHSCLLCKL